MQKAKAGDNDVKVVSCSIDTILDCVAFADCMALCKLDALMSDPC